MTRVPLGSISASADQPRKEFRETALRELADSIREKGILQPILVEEQEKGSFKIIAGERRWRAAEIAGLKEVPVIVRSYSQEEKLEIALIENIQRDDLTPVEEARAYKELMDKAKLGQEDLAKKIGKNRSTIANALRLLKLPEDMQEALNKRELSSGHARAVLSITNQADMETLFRRIIENGLSVRDAETMAADLNKGIRSTIVPVKTQGAAPPSKQKQVELREIEEKLLDIFGTKVSVSGNGKKGKIEISYFSADDLNRVYEILIKK